MNVVKELVAAASDLVAASKITSAEWLTVDQVRGMCAACADKMERQGINRVKASVFMASVKMAGRAWVTKLISPTGEEFWESYGPMVKDRSRAMKFNNPNVAEKAVLNRFGRGGAAFWESERQHESAAYKRYRDWTYEVKEDITEASVKTAADPLLEKVAKAIEGRSFMTLRMPLTALGIGKVDTYEGEQMHWRIKTRNGKVIVVVPKSGADVEPGDIEVGNLLVGYA